VLEHRRHDHGHLELLMGHGIPDPLLAAIKHMPAITTVRQMLKLPIDALARDQVPGLALLPGLATRLPHRALIRLPRRA
jgi:hypothetical protein